MRPLEPSPDALAAFLTARSSRRRLLRGGATTVGALAAARFLAACGGDDSGASTTAAPVTTGASATTGPGAATTAAAGELQSTRVGLAWIPNFEYVGQMLGVENGYYAEGGVDVDLVPGGPNAPDTLVSLAAGDIDIADVATLSYLIDAVSKGNEFVAVGAQYQQAPGGILSLAARPVLKPADLIGSKFLGQEGVERSIDAVLKVNHLEGDYEFIKASFTPDPLLEGQGDAYSCYIFNQPIALEQQGLKPGVDYFTVTWAELGLPSYGDLFVTTRSFLEEHRDIVVGFMHGTIKGWETNKLDPSVGPKLAAEKYGADLGLVLENEVRSNELQIPLLESDLTATSGLFRIDPELLGGAMYEALTASGVTDLPPVDSIIDLTVLDEVFGDSNTLL
jgi:ABC-type nitrate/sulfonate/bicarbonate transport system substrate-binding protein